MGAEKWNRLHSQDEKPFDKQKEKMKKQIVTVNK